MDMEVVKEFRKYLHVAHHVPGRIRIRFDAALVNHPKASEILNRRTTSPGIRSVRMNLGARSVIIEYDRERIPPEQLQEFFSTGDPSRIGEMISEWNEPLNGKERRIA